jgi:hypothetical protein
VEYRAFIEYLQNLGYLTGPVETLELGELHGIQGLRALRTFMGTDEVALPVYVGAMFDDHWNDHAGQIAGIRKAHGTPAV